MNPLPAAIHHPPRAAACRTVAVILCALLSGCGNNETSGVVQGYVEGEYVQVASPIGGELVSLRVRRGDSVAAGAPLFALEAERERAAVAEADRTLDRARATLADLRKGLRPSEIESLRAQRAEAQAALTLSSRELERLESLAGTGATSREDLDRARAEADSAGARVAQMAAELTTAELGSREDVVAAAEAEVRALEAAADQARWNLEQKSRAAPAAGLVFDTLFREGEWVAAGRPVVTLLPPENRKVRAFVPPEVVGSLRAGQAVSVSADGVDDPLTGHIAYISPSAEFTPPVIYSRESRSRLVFLIEIAFDAESAANLHPGQPVDVRLPND